ncbi:helix-turn-helix transcriptional regulator [Infirmifilum uzonense]|uniref:helix-turn-helix transcriptional regulator n=2 Tax=Thermofilaceae TaxID=114378 RepID=UPI003C78419D
MGVMVVTVHYIGFHPNLVFQGFEQIRLRYPIERVYLVYDAKPDRYGAVSRYNLKRLQDQLSYFKPKLVKVNPLSYSSVASAFYMILEYEKDKEILIDITDMPPYMASTVTVITMMFANARIYAVQPQQQGEFIPDPDTPEFADFIARKDNLQLGAVFEVEAPSKRIEVYENEREVDILVTLYTKNGSAESITKLIEWMGEDPRDPVIKATYSRIVASMEERGLLKRSREGRNRIVKLTELGTAIAEARVKLGVSRPPPAPPKPEEPLSIHLP